jgi:hypothetical protein
LHRYGATAERHGGQYAVANGDVHVHADECADCNAGAADGDSCPYALLL